MILICDDKLLTFALMLLTTEVVACETKILTFIAHERGKVELRCPYESEYEENKKYLCRGECLIGFKNILVESGSAAEDQRFSLTDDRTARVFTITITDLRTGDRGQYWCGITTGIGEFDNYTKIDLKIKRVSPVSAASEHNLSIACPYEDGLKHGVKFICKGSDPSLCVKSATKVSSDMRNNGRFSLKDDQYNRVFTVSIRDLTEEDSGIYWCGAVERQTHENKWISVTELIISKVSRVSAVSGQNVSMTCHYEDDLIDDVKFICKGSDPSLCVKSATKVSSEMSNNGRFSLKDDQSEGVFTVSIRDLTEEDSGIYWCGAVESQTHENKWISAKELIISNVSPEWPSPTETTTPSFHSSKPTETTSDRAVTSPSFSSSSLSSTSSSSSSQTTSPSLLLFPSSANEVLAETELGFTAVIMLIVIGTLTGFGFALFLYFRRRQKKEGTQPKDVYHQQTNHPPNGDLQTTRQDNHADYEEICTALGHPEYTVVLPGFGDPDISVYALAQLPRSSSDSLHYSSIRFSAKHRSDRTKTQDTSDYATVIH